MVRFRTVRIYNTGKAPPANLRPLVHRPSTSVADPHHFNADPDPDPACHIYADPDPDPACHLYADPDPIFHFVADPDPACLFDAIWILSFTLMLIRILLVTLMRIRIRNLPFNLMRIGPQQCSQRHHFDPLQLLDFDFNADTDPQPCPKRR
jgi:hypothetical protein